jgi:SAM-dependent methyltransferase
MHPDAMKPFGLALLDYFRGDESATLTVIRDDGSIEPMPASGFFRNAQEFEVERVALEMARGRVLDAGAGTGIHSKYLQEKGFSVCAIDILPQAVQIMQQQKVKDIRQIDIMSLRDEKFDTILMLGHGIGVVEDVPGLDRFLGNAGNILKPGGQILLTSLDVRVTNDPKNLAYQKHNYESGRYFGEIRMQFRYGDIVGPVFSWLHVDAQTLQEHGQRFGLRTEVILTQHDGNYLAKLTINAQHKPGEKKNISQFVDSTPGIISIP